MKQTKEQIRCTISLLTRLKEARANGYVGSYTTDLNWLVNMAVNRRAGWLDDPSVSRGSCCPVGGKYPKKAEGMSFGNLLRISREVNTPRLIVRPGQLGEWRKLILSRIPNRITLED